EDVQDVPRQAGRMHQSNARSMGGEVKSGLGTVQKRAVGFELHRTEGECGTAARGCARFFLSAPGFLPTRFTWVHCTSLKAQPGRLCHTLMISAKYKLPFQGAPSCYIPQCKQFSFSARRKDRRGWERWL